MTQLLEKLFQVKAPQEIISALSKHGRAFATIAAEQGCIKIAGRIISLLKPDVNQSLRVLYISETTASTQYAQSMLSETLREKGMTIDSFKASMVDGQKDRSVSFVSLHELASSKDWKMTFSLIGFDLVIVDRAHLAVSKNYEPLIRYINEKDVQMFGVTTVPTDKSKENKTLLSFFGEEVASISLEEGISLGWLSHFDYRVMDDGLIENFDNIIAAEIRSGKRPSLKSLNSSLFIEKRDEEIVAQIIEHTPPTGKALIFCQNIEQADTYHKLLINTGPCCRKYHSKFSSNLLEQNMDAFRDGNIKYLLVVDMADKLRDLPQIDAVFLARKTKSRNVFYDQLRVSLSINAKYRKLNHSVQLYDFVGALAELMEFQTFMEKSARKREEKKQGAETAFVGQGSSPALSVGLPLSDAGAQLSGAGANLASADSDQSPKPKSKKGTKKQKIYRLSGAGFSFEFSEKLMKLMEVAARIRLGYYPKKSEALVAIKDLCITSKEEYLERYMEDLRLHKSPQSFYKDFINWDEYLDTPVGFFFRLSEKEQLEIIKEKFAEAKIFSHLDLVHATPATLAGMDFGVFGKGVSFFGIILGENLSKINALVLSKVSQKLSWKGSAIVL